MTTTTHAAARAAFQAGEATLDTICWIRLSSVHLPLATPISDAKVLTGRQRPMTEVAFLFAEIATKGGTPGSASATPSAPAAPASSPTPRRSPPS